MLAAYIDQVFACLSDSNQKAMPAVEDLVPSDFKQHPVILLSQAILSLDDKALPPSRVADKSTKQVIFEQLRKIVNNYPGATWTYSDVIWSKNSYFDVKTNSAKEISVSPAQTLNLVCAGMISKSHYSFVESAVIAAVSDETGIPPVSSSSSSDRAVNGSSSSGAASSSSSSSSSSHVITQDICTEEAFDSAWITTQAKVLAQTLLRIAIEKAQTELDKCSGGYQHDLLWMLDGSDYGVSYLDANRRPFVFVVDFIGFLLQQLYVYIEKQIAPQKEEVRLHFYQDWLEWSLGASAEESPVMAVLPRESQMSFVVSSSASVDETRDETWVELGVQFMRARCEKIGVVLDSWAEGQIKAYIALLPTLEFFGKYAQLTLANELLRIELLAASQFPFASELVEVRNGAITTAQAQCNVSRKLR